ncbi:MBOAT family O-acyltransferase [Pelagibius sp. Alg239-R121]|uniref:MBOAT family O-acyltransferase n=1 Tax=Pelagibius sp. Alg239-R121 TaxID=2993448 RepID=UPI0024A61A78|nr:MBOAT family O-acyltransferase [Pelagibius sp. Alg239-R121]
MLADLEFYILALVASAVIFWAIPSNIVRYRTVILATLSAIFVFSISPGGFLAIGYLTTIAYLSNRVVVPRRRRTLLLSIIAALIPMISTRLFADLSALYTFGIAFSTVKSIGIVIDNYAKQRSYSFRQLSLFMFFFPLVTIGPVERIEKFDAEQLRSKPEMDQLILGAARIVWGIFLVHYICDALIDGLLSGSHFSTPEGFEAFSVSTAWTFVGLKFFYTYLNFVGFSEIAIGSGYLFGIKVIENFNRPLLVTNIQGFWQRYHISMGNWIARYLFFPIVGVIKKDWSNYAATLFAFIVFGAWHAFTSNYLFWGVMHGLAVAGYHLYRRILMPKLKSQPRAFHKVQALLGFFFTISYVAWLQTFANLDSFQSGLNLTLRMLTFP